MNKSSRAIDGPGRSNEIFIGIPILNRCDLLERCLESINYPARILVVNNNNVDQQFNDELEQLRSRDSRAVVLHQRRNLGVSASWNLILRTAFEEGRDWVFIASNDIVIGPQTLSAAINQLQSEDVGIWHLSSWNLFAISRQTVERAGWFDENFFPAYKEDQDYSHRCELAGIRRSNADTTDVDHLGSSTIRSNETYFKKNDQTHFGDNLEYYIKKWGGDAGSESYSSPFDDEQNKVSWWPSPGDSIHERDWDSDRKKLRES